MLSRIVPSMEKRYCGRELMDDPSSDEQALRATLRQFDTINRFLTRTRYLARTFFGPYVAAKRGETVSLLDVGAGGGDFARWFSAYCRARSVSAQITCIDTDPRVIAYARETCADYDTIQVVNCPAQRIDTLERRFDFVYAGHLLHHLPDEVIPGVLRNMYEVARKALVVSDVGRKRWVYVAYTLLAGVFLRHSMAFADGRLSIRRGFNTDELHHALCLAGLEGRLRVRALFPGRVYLAGSRTTPR
ncbi:MAG: methyltransferase domain-containing protein [Chitinivibrionales bacterium]|nr:methyltransferase domain-containing protein [Chitinivibrionales bacterium]MBD3358825.1 methyltransferase domain-containing protein [Chitinivibrionales bacterium]